MSEEHQARVTRASDRLDPAVRERIPDDFGEAIDFHGHLCPGLTIGYRAACIAMERLGVERGSDEQLLGIVETDACGVDAFQYLTGCTLGKGNLVYRDYGKQVFTLVRRSDGRAVRVALRPNAFARDDQHERLRQRVVSGEASEAERSRFWTRHVELALGFLDEPVEVFGTVADVKLELPTPARHFGSVICSICGESVMEPRSRVRDGEPCCIPCATKYGRGWEINE
ncbi:MAG: FmdE family protein [Coriobacteriia bacterium]|nr:FmdE family protein [Coriobacteriia bacterium]